MKKKKVSRRKTDDLTVAEASSRRSGHWQMTQSVGENKTTTRNSLFSNQEAEGLTHPPVG
jgi:hypothetical protein